MSLVEIGEDLGDFLAGEEVKHLADKEGPIIKGLVFAGAETAKQLSQGTVALAPVQAELTTRQAADLLQVSRTFLVRLLDEGRVPCRKVGSHRRVRTEDILAYRRDTESRRRGALDELTAQDQKLGLQ